MSRVAAIDLGTNTVRILVAEPNGAGFSQVFSGMVITRLGENLHNTGALAPQAVARTAQGISELLNKAKPFAPFELTITITSAGRSANNTGELDQIIRRRTGVGLTVIPWEEEARLALKGAAMILDKSVDNFILFDIGGGSCEYTRNVGGTLAGAYGTNLGVVRLAETYLTKHPVVETEYRRMMGEISATVHKAFRRIDADGSETIVGTAGTVTSLAAIAQNLAEYSPAKINNFRLTRKAVENILMKLSMMTLEERSRIPTLKNGREDLIIPGAAITLATLERAKKDFLIVSDYGLREGLIVDLLEKAESR